MDSTYVGNLNSTIEEEQSTKVIEELYEKMQWEKSDIASHSNSPSVKMST